MPPITFLKLHYFILHNSLDFWTLGDILNWPGGNSYKALRQVEIKVDALGNAEAREQRKGMVDLLFDGFLLPAPAFCETPRIHTMLAQVSFYYLQQYARNSWESFCSPNCSGWGKPSLLRLKYVFIQMTQRDRYSDTYSEMLVYQWYVKNVVSHLQGPEILPKYPCIHYWAFLTFRMNRNLIIFEWRKVNIT